MIRKGPLTFCLFLQVPPACFISNGLNLLVIKYVFKNVE